MTPCDRSPGDKGSAERRPRGFFGRRRGRPLRSRQAFLINHLLPRLAVDLARPAPEDLRALFPPGTTDVRLEIGFGAGEHLVQAARAQPHVGLIGVEPFVNGMAKALAAIDANALSNIRLHFGDALELLDWLPAAALVRVDLIYPDPWPKRRHWKRRFVQDRTIGDIARVVRAGGELRFATDVADYAAWTLERVLRSPGFLWTAERAADWRLPWDGFTTTRYEAKAMRAGRVPCYLVFRRR